MISVHKSREGKKMGRSRIGIRVFTPHRHCEQSVPQATAGQPIQCDGRKLLIASSLRFSRVTVSVECPVENYGEQSFASPLFLLPFAAFMNRKAAFSLKAQLTL